MKIILLLLSCSFGLFSQAQTAIIAHKSHSGTASDFFTDPSTNFGKPSPRLVQVIRLNDSTSVEVIDHYNGHYQYDTIYNNPNYANYNLNIDSIQQKARYRNVEYINFKKSPKSINQKSPEIDTQKMNEITPQKSQIDPKQEIPPKKKKKKNALLFIFLMTGGGLLLFRLFNRILTPRVAS
jgi:hypothetical protein